MFRISRPRRSAPAVEAVVMAGRLLGFIPDIETMQPFMGTSLGVGGYWNLPLTCHWLAVSRQQLGADKPLIATNGARNGLDAVRMMLAGASAVEMTSAVMLRGTQVLASAVEEFETYLQRKGTSSAELVGVAADRRKDIHRYAATYRQLEKIRRRFRGRRGRKITTCEGLTGAPLCWGWWERSRG